jgi:acyl-CoA dehydrogenase
MCVVRERLMPASAQLDALFALQGIGSYAIVRAGSDAQKERWLPGVAAGTALAALALTEVAAGSDLSAIETALDTRDDALVLNGDKSFISNAGVAAFYTVLAREGQATSLVLVPGDVSGLTIEDEPELIAPHVLGRLRFDDVVLASDARIGVAGKGMEHVLATLAVFRASVAAAAVGLAQEAMNEALAHACARQQFGKPLARQGQIEAMLADSWTEIEMARLLTYRAAARAASDPRGALVHSSMAKMAATETAAKVTDRAVQILGRFGLIKGSKVERLYRQARPLRIYEGASEVIRGSIARELVKSYGKGGVHGD